MKDEKDQDRSQQIALFRYGVIADLVNWPPGQRGLYARLREKAARSYPIPGSRRTRVAQETLRGRRFLRVPRRPKRQPRRVPRATRVRREPGMG